MNNHVVSIFTTFCPEYDFYQRIARNLDLFTHIIIVDDTGELSKSCCVPEIISCSDKVTIVKNKINYGIAYSLNNGVKLALKLGAEYIVTFDDDTEFCSSYVSRCLQFIKENDNISIGAVSMSRGSSFTCKNNDYKQKRALITSGLFCKASVYKDVGYFPNEYFIDLVDFYLALNMRKRDLSLIELCDVGMIHKVGNMKTVRVPFKINVFNHSPFRLYYQVRNTIPFFLNFWHVDFVFCVFVLADIFRIPVRAIFFEDQKGTRMKYYLKGLCDGITRRMGRLND